MARRYDMTHRAAEAAATRRRIVDAAHRLLADGRGGRLTVGEIADAAGVTRATVYNRVGPRRTLLATVFRDQGRLIEYGRVQDAIGGPDPREALVETVRESCRAWSVLQTAIRRTLALAALDREVWKLVRRYERSRRQELAGLVKRLHAQGALAPDTDVELGTSALALVTGFQSYDQLSIEQGHETATEQLVALAQSILLTKETS